MTMTERPRADGRRRRQRPVAPPPVRLPVMLSCRICHTLFVPHLNADGSVGSPATTPTAGPTAAGPTAAGPAVPAAADPRWPGDRYCSKACRRVGSRRER